MVAEEVTFACSNPSLIAGAILRNCKAYTIRKRDESPFYLQSGLRSHFFVNLAASYRPEGVLSPEHLERLSVLLANVLLVHTSNLVASTRGIIGVPLGGNPFARSLANFLGEAKPLDFIQTFKEDGRPNLVSPSRLNKKVIVVEDVLTTGASSARMLTVLQANLMEPVMLATVYNRNQGGKELIETKFDIPVVSLLDHNEFLGCLYLAGEIERDDLFRLSS